MVTNIAHRGARSVAPENTLLAAQRAFEIGADLWETDVAVTSDYGLILMHDSLLLRTTNVSHCFADRKDQPVHQFSLEEIRKLDAGSWFLDQDPFGQIAANLVPLNQLNACKGEKVPTVEEALVFTKQCHWKINLELKILPAKMDGFPLVAQILALIDRVAITTDQVIISSFNHRWLQEIRTLRPSICIQALVGAAKERKIDWRNFEFETYNVNHHLIDEIQIRRAQSNGKQINVFTVNAIADMHYYQKLGVTGLFTDFPQRLNELNKKSSPTSTS
jgi:glycerophosphoryl diester phosphodiesterase